MDDPVNEKSDDSTTMLRGSPAVTGPTNRRISTGVSLPVAFVSLSLALGFGARSAGAAVELALVFGLGAAMNLVAIWREVKERRFGEPLLYALCYLAIAYPVRLAATRLNWFNAREQFPGVLNRDDLVFEAVTGYLIGVCALLWGYGWRRVPTLRNPSAETTRGAGEAKTALLSALGLLAVGSAVWLFSYATNRYSTFAGAGQEWKPELNVYFVHLGNYGWLGVILVALCMAQRMPWSRRPKGLTLLALGIAALVVIATVVLQASKTWMVAPVVWFFMAWQLNGRRVRMLPAAFAGLAALSAAFLIIPVMRDKQLGMFGAGSIDFRESATAFRETVGGVRGSEDETEGALAAFINRFEGIDNAAMARLLSETGIEPLWFRELVLAPIALLPRLILPDKPSFNVATWFSREVVGMVSGGSAAPHPIAEGFLNGGFVGVGLLCGGWGLLLRTLVRLEGRYGGNTPGGQIIRATYVYFSFEVIGFGAWVLQTAMGLIHAFALTSPVLWLAFRLDRKARRARERSSRTAEKIGRRAKGSWSVMCDSGVAPRPEKRAS